MESKEKISSPQTNVIDSAWPVVKTIIPQRIVIQNLNYFVTTAGQIDIFNQFA